MDGTDIKNAIKEGLKDPEVLNFLREQLFATQIEEQYLRINDLEQYGRKSNIIVSGIPEHTDESTMGLIIELARILDVSLTPGEIVATHRIGRKSDQPGKHRPIIVRFVTFAKRDDLYRERKGLREIVLPRDTTFTQNMVQNVFISDNLTRYNSALMFACRELKRDGRLTAAWTDSGRIKVKVNDGPTRPIRSASDLRKLVGDHPALDTADDLLHGRRSPADIQNRRDTRTARAQLPATAVEADRSSQGSVTPRRARAEPTSSPNVDPSRTPTSEPCTPNATGAGGVNRLGGSAGSAGVTQGRPPQTSSSHGAGRRDAHFGRRGRSGRGRGK